MTVITLMTDFGIKDGPVGVMKGVIWVPKKLLYNVPDFITSGNQDARFPFGG